MEAIQRVKGGMAYQNSNPVAFANPTVGNINKASAIASKIIDLLENELLRASIMSMGKSRIMPE
jgi:hypothetical protein